MRLTLLPLLALALVACRGEGPADDAAAAPAASDAIAVPAPAPAAPALPADDATPAADPAAVLAGNAWRVERRSDGGEIGATYAFLADGTLVVDSPNGTPATGRWTVEGGALSLVEEGVAYPADLVVRDADHVTLRSHNPGGVVEIALVRAPDVPMPAGD